jgi:hypothetical protein
MLKHGNAGDSRKELPQQLEAFGTELWSQESDPSDITAGPAKAGDESIGYRIGHNGDDDRNGISCSLGRQRGVSARNDHNVNVETDELVRQPLHLIHLTVSVLDGNALSGDVTKLLKPSINTNCVTN